MKLQRSPVVFHLLPASLLSLSPPLFSAATAVQRCRCSGPAGRPPPACASRPRVAPDRLHRPCLSAGALLSLPRAPETTAGRHIFVAVASSDRVPAAPSFVRIRTGGSPRPIPLTIVLFPRPQTPEHLRCSPERRRASSSPSTHSSKAPPPVPTSPLAPPRSRAANRPPLVDHPPPEHPCRRDPLPPQPCPLWTALL